MAIGRSHPDLGSFGNMGVTDLGQSSESLHPQAVGMVECRTGTGQSGGEGRVGRTPESSPDLNPLENLREIL